MRINRSHRLLPGLTLIETIVAMVVLAVAVPGTLWAIRDAAVQRVAPLRSSKARWLVTEKLEDIVADRNSTTRGYAYVLTGNYPSEASISGFPGFTRTTTIAETAADLVSAGTGYKKVTVSVGWTDTKGVARQVSISTVLTDY